MIKKNAKTVFKKMPNIQKYKINSVTAKRNYVIEHISNLTMLPCLMFHQFLDYTNYTIHQYVENINKNAKLSKRLH